MEILQQVGYVIFGGLFIYLGYNQKVQKIIKTIAVNVAVFIKETEQAYQGIKPGEEKFNIVVDKLYKLIPTPFNLVIKRNIVESLVESTFTEMEKYAKTQLDKVVDEVEEKVK